MYFKPKSGLWFAPSTDNATGTSPAVQPPADPSGNGSQVAAQSNGGSADPHAPPPATAKSLVFESEDKLQQHIETVLKERLERERKKTEKAAQEAREKAEADAAAKNGEWQKLAETREGKIKELSVQVETITVLQEKADKYEKALKTYLDTQRTGLPEHVIVLLDKLDAVEQLEYISQNRAVLTAVAPAQQVRQNASAIPPTPAAGNPATLTAEQQQQAKNAQKA